MLWYADEKIPSGSLWWAVEHRGHAAFYLRALMAGDFRPGLLPLPRHAFGLEGQQLEVVTCGTCGEVPRAEDLEPIERRTHARGFFEVYRLGVGDSRRRPWPNPTSPTSCWLCSNPRVAVDRVVDGRAVCAACAAHLERK